MIRTRPQQPPASMETYGAAHGSSTADADSALPMWQVPGADDPVRVLFMQSQSFFGADSYTHALLMRHFDRREVLPYVALTTAEAENPGVCAMRHIGDIPGVAVRPTYFGPSLFGVHGLERARRTLHAPRVPLSLLSLAQYIRRHDIQVIHATEKPRDAFYGALLSKLTGAKLVVHLHVKFEEWIRGTAKWAIDRADAIVGVSRYVAQSAIDAGYPPERVYHVLNSIDLSDSRWNPTLDGTAARQSLGIPDDAPLLGIVSRLFSWKGHGDLLDALVYVKQQVPSFRLVIVGEDDARANPGGGSYRAQLEAQARRLGLEEHVIFAGFRTDIPELMAAMDVYTMPTWEEPFGVVFVEAMAMEKPIVAWDSGGAPEIIEHGRTGFVIQPKLTESLAESIVRLLRDAPLRRRFGVEGRRRAEEVFNPQRMCRDMAGVYRAVVQQPVPALA